MEAGKNPETGSFVQRKVFEVTQGWHGRKEEWVLFHNSTATRRTFFLPCQSFSSTTVHLKKFQNTVCPPEKLPSPSQCCYRKQKLRKTLLIIASVKWTLPMRHPKGQLMIHLVPFPLCDDHGRMLQPLVARGVPLETTLFCCVHTFICLITH